MRSLRLWLCRKLCPKSHVVLPNVLLQKQGTATEEAMALQAKWCDDFTANALAYVNEPDPEKAALLLKQNGDMARGLLG